MEFDENEIGQLCSEKGFHQVMKAKMLTWVNSTINEGIEFTGGIVQGFYLESDGMGRIYNQTMSIVTQGLIAEIIGKEIPEKTESLQGAFNGKSSNLIETDISDDLLESFQKLSVEQRLLMVQGTDERYIKQRKGRAGMQYNYVKGHYMHRAANLAFLFKWGSEIETIERNNDEIICIGTVTAEINGVMITKAAIGQADVKFKKGTKDELGLGDDYKAAMTDMEKKGLSKFGIAADVYGGYV